MCTVIRAYSYMPTKDDKRWVAEIPEECLIDLMKSPDVWVADHIYSRSDLELSRPAKKHHVLINVIKNGSRDGVTVANTCSTSPIEVIIQEKRLARLLGEMYRLAKRDMLDQLDCYWIKSGDPHSREPLAPAITPAEFWAGLDTFLPFITRQDQPEIRFVIDQYSLTAAIHIELGDNHAFIFALLACAAMDMDGYLNWLRHGSSQGGSVVRNAYRVKADGMLERINLSDVAVSSSSNVNVLYDYDPANPCPPQCTFMACNNTTGLAEAAASGLYTITVSTVLAKAYCLCPVE